MEDSILEFYLKENGALNLINGVSNNLILSEEQILANLQDIQASNEIKVSGKLDGMHFSMIDGIKYQKIGGSEYEMTLFEAQELEVYLNDFSFKVSDPSKTIYEEFMPLDSGVESKFAQDCETSDQIKFYFKLPNWFKIPTPIGNYNPDWALVFEDDNKIYFVSETKDTGTPQVDLSKLSGDEQMKIKCGKAHLKNLQTWNTK